MRTKKKFLLGSALVAALALTACGGASGGEGSNAPPTGEITGTVTLQTWSLTPKFTDYLNGVITGFEAKHPGTNVELVDQPGDGYSEKVLSQAAANNLPDVVNLPPDFALPLAQQDLLLDVSQAVPDLEETYVQGSIDAFRFKGVDGVYGVPWYLNTDVNYWNAPKLDKCGLDSKKPPATQQELFAQAKIMHDACPDEYLMSRKPGIGDFVLEGIPVTSEDGKSFVFNTPQATALLDQYRDAYANGYLPATVLNSDYQGNAKLFTQGKVAWTTGGATALGDFEGDNPSLKGKIAVSKALNTPPLYVQGVSVAKSSKNPATAVALATWLTNAENQNAFAHLVNVFPSTIASADDPYLSKNDGTPSGTARTLAFESLKTAKVLTPYEVNTAMNTILDQQIALAIKGDISSQEALDTAVEKLNQMLGRQ